MATPAAAPTTRLRGRLRGVVQGVGFRPFVYREATGRGLTGHVSNDGEGVVVEVQGPAGAVEDFRRSLVEHPPPLARVEQVTWTALHPDADGATGFRILRSVDGAALSVPVSPDAACCAACLAEVADPAARRYRYPFTNCTDCGPRYTIVRRVPYDRPSTTMAGFAMCPDCRAEYEDPSDRRFHAQPIACPACGPSLRLVDPAGALLVAGDGALEAAASLLAGGRVVAVKGLGGYHLAVDATDPGAVAQLRRRKGRDAKPFAVMAPDLDTASRLGRLDAVAAEALSSPAAPIVVVPTGEVTLAPAVAPGATEVGLMLPYTPLHHLLAGTVGRALVLTSGNRSDEPIAHHDDDALHRLGPLVDALLTHDRPIHIRCDDSVVAARGGRLTVIRRSRGYAPRPLPLPPGVLAEPPVLAVGAELKSTVALARGGAVIASHHIGDLEHLDAHRSFLQAVEHLCHLWATEPGVVAHDLHPDYRSSAFAAELDLPACAVGHHHAHVASCLVDHRRRGPVLGVAFDGLGMGTDGTFWGGEFLVADLRSAVRVAHLAQVPMPGGTAAIREPWRMALAWVSRALGPGAAARVGGRLDARAGALVAVMEAAGPGGPAMPLTSSAGRLFDAVAALAGVRSVISYEGQAAIELEALASAVPVGRGPCYDLEVSGSGGLAVLDAAPMVAAIVADLDAGVAPAAVAAGFHDSLAIATAGLAARTARAEGLGTVALSGGVMQNSRFSSTVAGALRAEGLEVLEHCLVPPNDGGISIGQAAVAASVGGKDTY